MFRLKLAETKTNIDFFNSILSFLVFNLLKIYKAFVFRENSNLKTFTNSILTTHFFISSTAVRKLSLDLI